METTHIFHGSQESWHQRSLHLIRGPFRQKEAKARAQSSTIPVPRGGHHGFVSLLTQILFPLGLGSEAKIAKEGLALCDLVAFVEVYQTNVCCRLKCQWQEHFESVVVALDTLAFDGL